MPGIAASSFNTLRTWNGEQSRVFEELSFQLLKDQLLSGTRAIRTGNPDGGVQWHATLPDNTEWDWQVKNVKGIDALLTAMTDSVERVTKKHHDVSGKTLGPLLASACFIQHLLDQIPQKNVRQYSKKDQICQPCTPPGTDSRSSTFIMPITLNQPPPKRLLIHTRVTLP